VLDGDAASDADEVDAMFEAAGIRGGDATHAAIARAPAREARTRALTAHVGNLLTTRAYLGKLDRRAAAALRPVLATGAKYEHRRTAVVSILGAMRDRESVPAMIRILASTPIASALDAIGKQELVTATVRALGMIGDPRAIPALSQQIVVPGPHNDAPRVPAALALSSCMAAAPAPPEPAAELFEALLRALHDLSDDAAAETLRVAYSALAARSSPARRDRALVRLHTLDRGRGSSDAAFEPDDDGQVN
jgi:HEAT repeat protein